jgi:hypothetical protein
LDCAQAVELDAADVEAEVQVDVEEEIRAKIKSIKQKRTVIRARRGGMTPAGKKRLSEAMKKHWAEKRKKRG